MSKTNFLNLSFLLFVFAFCMETHAQGDISLSLIIQAQSQKPIANIPVTTIETSTLEKHTYSTNEQGKIKINLKAGKVWKIQIGKIPDAMVFNAIPYSVLTVDQTYIYDYPRYLRSQQQVFDRKDSEFKVIRQGTPSKNDVTAASSLLKYHVYDKFNRPQSNVPISVVNLKDSVMYSGKTNASGIAHFLLPNHTQYDVDFGTAKNYDYFDTDAESTIWTQNIEFTKTVVNETNRNDTIVQKITPQTQASSERALVTIKIVGGRNKGIKEKIHVESKLTGKIYENVSDSKAQVQFLIPHSEMYFIHLRNQKNVDILDLRSIRANGVYETTIHYLPNPRLEYPERFFPTPEDFYLPALGTYLTKQYEKPTKKAFRLKFRQAETITPQSKEALFLLEITGTETSTQYQRKPVNLCFVLDKSGSMYAEERSEALKTSLWKMGSMLEESDVTNFIFFDTDAYQIAKQSDKHVENIQKIIENYNPGGGTNIFKGIKKGVEVVKEDLDPAQVNKVILLTDGFGITPPMEITNYVKEQYKQGIEFSTIGMGECNLELLDLISKSGNGTFNVIRNPEDLSNVLLREIDESFGYVATDVSISVTHNKKLIFKKLYGYPVENVSNSSIDFTIAKVPRGLNEIAFMKFKLNKPDATIENEPLEISISYFDVVLQKQITSHQTVQLTYAPESDTELLMKQHEQELYAISIINQTIKNIVEYKAGFRYDKVEQTAKSCRKQLKEIFPNSKPKEVKAVLSELDQYMVTIYKIREMEGR